VTGKTITYAELLDKSLRLAAGFRDFGIKEGDSVGFSSENNMDFYVVVLATFFVGATIAPINPTYVESKIIRN
jgi:acyl-CoA synthetase (AMP-forming)/AMP-acid ligase II